MRSYLALALAISLVVVGTVVLAGERDSRNAARHEKYTAPSDFNNYINNRPPVVEHYSWGAFLGTGSTEETRREWDQGIAQSLRTNPFTGQPFPADTKIFVFGKGDPISEGLRIVTDHLEVPVLSGWDRRTVPRFDFVICHSNGCTKAIDLQRRGLISTKVILALGTDWTSKDFRPGELKGAQLYFFAMKGDPIWKIPAPSWALITRDTPGFKFSVPFDRPTDIVKGMGDRITKGRTDPDRFPVIPLTPPPGQEAALLKPFRPHAIIDSYFKSIDGMTRDGFLPKGLRDRITQWEARPPDGQGRLTTSVTTTNPPNAESKVKLEANTKRRREDQLPLPPSGCPPWCDQPGGTSGIIGRTAEVKDSVLVGHRVPQTTEPDKRGGVAAPIEIRSQDFISK